MLTWVGLFWVHFVTFWAAAWGCYLVDPRPDPRYGTAAAQALRVQLGVHLPLSTLLDLAAVISVGTQAPVSALFWQLPVALALADGLFYYAHRAFHAWPWLYARVHAHHHRWVVPVGVAALDTHPAEHLACNLLPLGIGFRLVGMSDAGAMLSVVAGTLNLVVMAHGGFRSMADGHDAHHRHRNCNYGIGPVMLFDRLHGTFTTKAP